MKKNLFKVTALLFAMVMMLTVVTGCGGAATTSDPVSEDLDDGFVAGTQDYDASAGDSNGGKNDATVSTSANNSGSNGNTSSGSGNSDKVDIFKSIPKELKGKTVVFSDWGEAITDEYQKVLAQFTKDTGIRVRMMQFLNTEYITKVAQQIAAGKSPDIAASNYWFPTALEMMQPLPEYFDLDDGFWDKRIAQTLSVNGTYYFVNSLNTPIITGYMLYYSKSIFNACGAKTPLEYYQEGTWSWENLKKAAKDVVAAGYKGAIVDPMMLAGQMGATMIDYDPKTGKFSGNATNKDLIKALEYYSTGYEDGLFYNQLSSHFRFGGIGMTMLGTYSLKTDGELKDMMPNEFDVVPLPTMFEGKKLEYFPAGMRGYGIAKGAENPQAAYYMLRYFLDLDKYEPAGANMFANKKLEKYYRETHLPLYQTSKMQWEHYREPLMIIDARWDTPQGKWTGVRNAATGQIAVELSKRANIIQNAVDQANQKIKDFASTQ